MVLLETHIVPANMDRVRLQEYAVSIFESAPTRSSIKKAIKRGLLKRNGEPASTGDWILGGERIELFRRESQKQPFRLPLEILFEDEQLAVVNKPAGYPTSGNYFRTIERALPYNIKKNNAPAALPDPVPVHRLDNPTSGLLLIAKTAPALRHLHLQFQQKTIYKTYHAIVWGNLRDQLEIKAPIGGKPAHTTVVPEGSLMIRKKKATLIRALPHTGRTHQIRIHLAKNNLPITGDQRYGPQQESPYDGKLLLSATGLMFQHPVTGKWQKIHTELPLSFSALTQ